MEAFVGAVDDVPLPPEVQKSVTDALTGAGFTLPDCLPGTPGATIDTLIGTLVGPAGGLLKRTFERADDVAAAKRVRAVAASPPGAQPGLGGAAAASHLSLAHLLGRWWASWGMTHQRGQWRVPLLPATRQLTWTPS